MTALAFVDTETTHLDPRFGDVWEVAVIRREHGVETEYLWQVRPDLATADPEALKIGRYEERFAVPDGWDAVGLPHEHPPWRLTMPEFLYDLQTALRGAVMVGSNPAFDAAHLTKLLQDHGRRIPWHYRVLDIATLAAGYMKGRGLAEWHPGELLTPPYSSRDLSRAVGVEPPGDDGHQALVDARWARDVYDAVTGDRQAVERAA
ncbi:3'-5' exonuclease [Streptomyces aculeolatus]|uniref:3'-5' exonuclease n=1 Tax=Streptomyces aculeolatus TaxID=270689 RepID=UPI001CED209C|nr:hypothetical protein [Streptomyces aculeolatus]